MALVHQVERLVAPSERQLVRDETVDVDFSAHVPVHNPGYIGAAARTSEGRTLPDAAGDELKRPCGDLLPRSCNPDDHADAPAAMTAIERLAHQFQAAYALQAVVRPAVPHRDQLVNEA